jgi:hypothetical protein
MRLRGLLFATTTVTAPLVVFMVTEPKLSEEGVTPTPASVGTGNKTAPIKKIPINRDTSRALTI